MARDTKDSLLLHLKHTARCLRLARIELVYDEGPYDSPHSEMREEVSQLEDRVRDLTLKIKSYQTAL
jgi:hypothetical protein